MRYLRQSTASQSRLTPIFVDDTDFKTPETGLTIANTDVKLSKNGASSVNKNSGGGTHITTGRYALTFDATDTNTVGELAVAISVAGALPMEFQFWVLEEAVFDALFAASAPGYGTAQTGDSYARLGAPAGASISADIVAFKAVLGALNDAAADGDPTNTDTAIAYIKQLINTLEGTAGIPSFPAAAAPGNAVSLAEIIRSIYAQLGIAGAGLSAIPWNADWDAEVQSEAEDALNAYDPPTRAEATSDKDEILTRLGVPAGADIATDIADVASDAASAASDAATVAGTVTSGRVKAKVEVVDAGVIDAAATSADFLTEISNAIEALLSSTARAELGAVPAANASLAAKLTWLAMLARNKLTNDGSDQVLFADDGSTPVGTAPVGESGGVVTRGEFA